MTRLDRRLQNGTIVAMLVGAGLLAACVSAPPNLTPVGKQAFNNTRVIKALDVIRDTAIDANAQTPPLLSTAFTRKVVTFHESAVKTIQASPGGWVATVSTGLDEVVHDASPGEQAIIGPYVTLLKTLITEIARPPTLAELLQSLMQSPLEVRR